MTDIGVIIDQPSYQRLFSRDDQARLHGLGTVHLWPGDTPPSIAEASEFLAPCTIGVGSWGTPHPGRDELVAACPHLRMWEHVAGSVKAHFSATARARALTIASCKGAIADSVAEYVVGLMIVGLRQMLPNAAANKRKNR